MFVLLSDPDRMFPTMLDNTDSNQDHSTLSLLFDHHGYDRDDWVEQQNHCLMFDKLAHVRKSLCETYVTEFLPYLMDQATNISNRYVPKKHHKLAPGDIVIIKDCHSDKSKFQLGIFLMSSLVKMVRLGKSGS